MPHDNSTTVQESKILRLIAELEKTQEEVAQKQNEIMREFAKYNNAEYDEAIFATAFDALTRPRMLTSLAKQDFKNYLQSR